jgi:hypothetical protein
MSTELRGVLAGLVVVAVFFLVVLINEIGLRLIRDVPEPPYDFEREDDFPPDPPSPLSPAARLERRTWTGLYGVPDSNVIRLFERTPVA